MSLNELDALAKKATRGVGYPWGLAEEAAKAVRWLCERDVDGCLELAELLTLRDGADPADWMPVLGNTWAGRGDRLCPIATGAALSDHADALNGAELRIENVARPLLMAPFAGLTARHLDLTVALAWDDTVVATDGDDLSIDGDTAAPLGTLTVRTGARMGAPRARRSRVEADACAFATLNRLAHRTYAPATEDSRLKGAGAGLSDND